MRAREPRARAPVAARDRARASRDRSARRLPRRVEELRPGRPDARACSPTWSRRRCRSRPRTGSRCSASRIPRGGSRTSPTHLEREVTIAETQRALSQPSSDERDGSRRTASACCASACATSSDELGEQDPGIREVEELREKLEAAKLPEVARAQADRELQRLAALPQHAPDRHLIRTYVEWMIDLPWSKETEDTLDLRAAREVLDADHHDLEKVKDRILEFLAVRKLAPDRQEPDPLLRRTARRRQDLARPLDRARARPRVRARVARRRARRGGDPRPPAHLRRRDARPHPAEPAPRRLAQPGLPARRDRQARHGLPRRSLVGAARGARPGAERHVQRSLPRGPVRPLAGDVHRDREHARDDPARAARPHGGDRAARLHRARQAPDRAPPPRAEAARGARARRRGQIELRDDALEKRRARVHARGRRAQPRAPHRDACCARSRAASPRRAPRREPSTRRCASTRPSSTRRSARRRTCPRPPSARRSPASSSASRTRATAATSCSSRRPCCPAARACACASPASSAT